MIGKECSGVRARGGAHAEEAVVALHRYHILILREDGRQYHNRILEWFQVRRHLTSLITVLGLLVLGNVGFFFLASWQGSLLVRTSSLKAEKARLQDEFSALSQTLDATQQRVSESAQKLAQLEELARQQNLTLPDVAGTGGPATSAQASDSITQPT